MPRPSGFTEAELAAAAWRRNMKNKGSMNDELESSNSRRKDGVLSKGRSSPDRHRKKRERGKERRKSSSGKGKGARKGKGSSATTATVPSRRRRVEERRERKAARGASVGSVDSLGREVKKRDRSRSPSSSSSKNTTSSSRRQHLLKIRHRSRDSKKRHRSNRKKKDDKEELGEGGTALGWRNLMARASRSASISSKDSLGSSGSGSGSSDWSLGGSASREWDTDRESLADRDPSKEPRGGGGGGGASSGGGLLDTAYDVPDDPHRPDHDDRDRSWRGAWPRGVSTGIMSKGRGANARSAGDLADWDSRRRGRDRRRDLDKDFNESDGRGRGSRGRSPGDGSSARSLSRSISRDRRSRRSSRSRSPTNTGRRSRSRDRAVSSFINKYGQSSGMGGNSAPSGGEERRPDLDAYWGHDLFDDTAAVDSPRRLNLPSGYKPEPESWVSRAGGVYVPVKPT